MPPAATPLISFRFLMKISEMAPQISVISWPVAVTTFGSGPIRPSYPHPVPPVLVGLAIVGMQLRHSLAAAA